ncbi:FG-GAP repeat domain-containing protein [Tautonia marina]|uniref:FG-GAP repeat domain-containing protein n=1 Tax=Tautonia marina TaxID=2653855 RepID=UPI0012612211|nr:VCBS repeat-containing protein [Tautonia marina]
MRPFTMLSLMLLNPFPGDDEAAPPSPLPSFKRIVIDDTFPGGYQVEVADVNGDTRPDIIALGGGTCAWYENPSWQKRIITGPDQTPGIISSATTDLDGDGRAEVAIAYDFAMREPTRGKLGLARPGASPDDKWSFQTIAEVPSIHRLRWGDTRGDGRLDLIVAPIFGPDSTPPAFQEDSARLMVFPSFTIGANRPKPESVALAPVMHAIAVVRLPENHRDSILSASNLGVSLHRRAEVVDPESPHTWLSVRLTPGASGTPPARGASEIHLGHFGSDHALLATIEPWHGSNVAISTIPRAALTTVGHQPDQIGPRTILDDSLDDGHALWLADVNGDGIDEVFAGHRGTNHRVSVYHFDGKTWQRTILDSTIAAQDLRGGDLNQDGIPDIVAIGGTSQNVIWYRPRPASTSASSHP